MRRQREQGEWRRGNAGSGSLGGCLGEGLERSRSDPAEASTFGRRCSPHAAAVASPVRVRGRYRAVTPLIPVLLVRRSGSERASRYYLDREKQTATTTSAGAMSASPILCARTYAVVGEGVDHLHGPLSGLGGHRPNQRRRFFLPFLRPRTFPPAARSPPRSACADSAANHSASASSTEKS